MNQYKFVYFNSISNIIIYFNSLDELKEYFYKVCNPNYLENCKEKADKEFYDHMKDGYLIIDNRESCHFYIELQHINKIFDEVFDDYIVNFLKKKISENNL